MKKYMMLVSFLSNGILQCSDPLVSRKEQSSVFKRDTKSVTLPHQRFLDLVPRSKIDQQLFIKIKNIDTVAYPDTTPYNEATFLVAHNAHASKAYGWRYRQQNLSITALLNYGIRGIMLDVHPYKNDAYLCHGPCETITKLQRSPVEAVKSFLGYDPQYQSLRDALEEIKKWMRQDKSAIVTIFLENYVDDSLIQKVLSETIKDFIFTPQDLTFYRKEHKEHWPMLGYLREYNKRIICFNEKKGGSPLSNSAEPFFFQIYDHVIESQFGSTEQDICRQRDESIAKNNEKRYLYMFNFFSYPSSENDAKKNNSKEKLLGGIRRCMFSLLGKEKNYVPQNKKPNFLALDFAEIGDGLEVIKILNQKEVFDIKEYEINQKQTQAAQVISAARKAPAQLSFFARFYDKLRASYNHFFKK